MPAIETDATFPFWLDADPADASCARIGLTESFLETLKKEGRDFHVVALDLLPIGSRLKPGDSIGMLALPDRSVDLRLPFAAILLACNQAAIADPRLVHLSPYSRGWLAEIELS